MTVFQKKVVSAILDSKNDVIFEISIPENHENDTHDGFSKKSGVRHLGFQNG